MTYQTGGLIQAIDYNTFASLATGMNKIFASGSGDFGYGQSPALPTVAPGDPIRAADWASLFQSVRRTGTHQGAAVVPPLPATDPVAGQPIVPFTGLQTLINSLQTNRFNIAAGQGVLTVGAAIAQPPSTPWKTSLTFHCQVIFPSWDAARYFFNAGGYLSFNGTYSPVATSEDSSIAAMLAKMSNPTVFNHNSTTNALGGGTGIGFYNLTSNYQNIYHTTGGSGSGGYYYYGGNELTISARLAGAPGSASTIDIMIEIADTDTYKGIKNGQTVYHINNLRSAGAIVTTAPTVGNISFVSAV